MFRQVGPVEYAADGTLKKGVIIRHLVLPGQLSGAKDVMDWVAEHFAPGQVLFSLMSQYLPWGKAAEYPEINRRLRKGEARKAAEYMELLGLDGIVSIGGDGSFRGLVELAKQGISVVGVPATIDNDIVCTDYTIGYDTAANTAVEAIDRLRDTMQSHERCSVVEVMGRNAGHLALYVGLATGATAVLVPEKPVDFDRDVINRIRQARLAGNTHFMIIVAEGAGSAIEIGKGIHEELGLDPRVTILGHIQRGGTPSARDRVMASRMGYHAVKTLADGKTNRVICARAGQMVDIDITEGLSMKKGLNEQQYEVLQAMTGIDN